jgi:hypothetical protein
MPPGMRPDSGAMALAEQPAHDRGDHDREEHKAEGSLESDELGQRIRKDVDLHDPVIARADRAEACPDGFPTRSRQALTDP